MQTLTMKALDLQKHHLEQAWIWLKHADEPGLTDKEIHECLMNARNFVVQASELGST